jgi:hypothetical protein
LKPLLRHLRHLFLISCSALLVSACGGGGGYSGPSTPSVAIDGTWKASGMVVGSSLTLVLTSQNAAVSGTGTYSREAGGSGTLTITGTYTYPQVALTFVFDNGPTETYAGSLSSANQMDGTATTAGTTSSLSFTR